MASCDQPNKFPHLLSQQLHGLSELCEIVTLRLLELEERVQILEGSNHLKGFSAEDAAEELLAKSEERVRNLQGLLDVDREPKKPLTLLEEQYEAGEVLVDSQSESVHAMELIEDHSGELNDGFSKEENPQKQDHFEDTEYLNEDEMPLLSA
ncbi:hypothetical protein [Prochlorococcus sp. MIT 1341]|uniref:hypothetical protein n=1 Tax=Prochlorococcus sp. MIT 1341 TaxID=3096221 RepID=UPI002A7506AD|nr:hypothetical protein [Prochlorococcus sp. MIT 1341]